MIWSKAAATKGNIKLRGQSVFQIKPDVISLRKRIGTAFEKTNPFQKSIYENVVFGLRMAGQNNRKVLDANRRNEPLRSLVMG